MKIILGRLIHLALAIGGGVCIFRVTLLVLIGASTSAYSQIKCTNAQGVVVYQDRPCSTGVTEKDLGQVIKMSSSRLSSGKSLTLEQWTTYPNEEFAQTMFDLVLLGTKKLSTPTPQEIVACVEKYRSIFKDPMSVYPVDSGVFEQDGKAYLVISVSARNGFGGAARRKIACEVDRKATQQNSASNGVRLETIPKDSTQEEEEKAAVLAAKRQRAKEDEKNLSLKQAKEKEAAWSKFYVKTPGCQVDYTGECANAFTQSKMNFEVYWSKVSRNSNRVN
jgi:hypothetical protein